MTLSYEQRMRIVKLTKSMKHPSHDDMERTLGAFLDAAAVDTLSTKRLNVLVDSLSDAKQKLLFLNHLVNIIGG